MYLKRFLWRWHILQLIYVLSKKKKYQLAVHVFLSCTIHIYFESDKWKMDNMTESTGNSVVISPVSLAKPIWYFIWFQMILREWL